MCSFTEAEEAFIAAQVTALTTARQIRELHQQLEEQEREVGAAQEALGLTNATSREEAHRMDAQVEVLFREAASLAGYTQEQIDEQIGAAKAVIAMLDSLSRSDIDRLASEFGVPTV